MLGTAPLVALLAAAGQRPRFPEASGLHTFTPPAPVVILIMCAVAGIGTVLLLPSRRETPLRKIGGAVVLAVGLIFAALLVRGTARVHPDLRMGVYFWAFSAIALGAALRVVTHTRPVYSALYFVLTVFATAGLFILLWAEFMAAALVLIYAGAILVTYVFVIMLATSSVTPAATPGARRESADGADDRADGNGDGRADHTHGEAAAPIAGLAEHDAVSREPLVAASVGFVLMGILLFVVFDRGNAMADPASRSEVLGVVVEQGLLAERGAKGETQRLGVYLFENHFVNLELAGLLLTISMVGAIVIARRRIYTPPGARGAGAGAARGGDVFTAPMTPVNDDPHSIPVYGTDNPRQKAYPEA